MEKTNDLEKYKQMVSDKSLWAITHKQRRKGLSRIDIDSAPTALYFEKCKSVHTFGMKFDLEIIYFDKAGNYLGKKFAKPRRLIKSLKGTYSILEIPKR